MAAAITGSADGYPASTSSPATTAPAEPSRSAPAWIRAPRRLRFSRSPSRSSTHTGMPLASSPMRADDHDRPTGDGRLGAHKPLERLPHDHDAEHDQRDAVDERSEHLGPAPAEGACSAGRESRRPRGRECQRDRKPVGDVVHRVGDQREAAEQIATHRLDQAERDREDQRDSKCPPTPGGVGMTVVRVRMSHRQTVACNESAPKPCSE